MKNQNRKTFFMFLLAFLIAFFIVSLIEVLRSSFISSPLPDIPQAAASSPFASGDTAKVPLSFSDLAERVKPAVVNISTTKTTKGFASPFGRSPFGGGPFGDDFFDRFFGDIPQREFKQRSLGSGFIISNDGYIFTNNHVVEKADKIVVKVSDNREYEAKVVGTDPKTDIALIKIKPRNSLPVVEIGDSDQVRVGEWVIAIGNPFGLEATVTAGIVSAKGRVIGAGPYDNFIQTDASINPGNSGGPLFNMEGKVIGINTAIVAQGQGIGFAIPINMAKSILSDLKSKGRVTRGWLGISVQDITEDIAKNMNLKDRTGALVSDVFKDDPADKAGIKVGDIIIEINGKEIKDTHTLLLTIAGMQVGERAAIKVLRDGREMTFRVVVAERKDTAEATAPTKGTAGHFGIAARDITPEMARQLGVPQNAGVMVAGVEPGSPADEVGIQPQDIIVQVNRIKVSSMKEYNQEIAKAAQKKSVMLLIRRGNASFFVTLSIE
ncbi:MAG TPA: DegQ family serine endoprotease [Smithellaceae bacterium]|nr:DegQ family serine endoprotease [Smithellaceae bacterium]HRS90083.1 DegQ family serine endoprotease [Smithellaceae bacterium]HRV26933.1 DegQ family serine endoprotease [Smithellaceae bacterium]